MTVSKVTIGMPVYNGERTLDRAFAMLASQTFADFELIVSDNGSTDGTAGICRRWAARDARIRYVRQPENRGAGFNFAFVRQQARTPYFMWAAADDGWKPRFVESCVEVLDARPDVGLVFTGYEVVSQIVPLLRIRRFPDLSFVDDGDVVARLSRYIPLDGRTHKANAIYGLWRTHLANEADEALADFKPEGMFGLDNAVVTYALSRGRLHFIPEPLFIKTSKWFPSGSLLDRVFCAALYASGYARRPQERDVLHALDRHCEFLRTAVGRAGVDAGPIEPAIEAWHRRTLRMYGIHPHPAATCRN